MKRRARSARSLRKLFERVALACAVAPAAAANACSTSSTPATSNEPADASSGASDAGISDAAPDDANALCAPITVAVDASNPDGGIECGIFEKFSCAIPPSIQPRSDCYFGLNDCPALCPGVYFFNCHAYGNWCDAGSVLAADSSIPLDDGSIIAEDPVIVECQACPNGAGRRPPGLLAARRTRACTALGRHFAEIAHLEAASITAFRTLRKELASHGAPTSLLSACTRAAGDEIRHARATARIARRHGASPPAVEIAANEKKRSLETIAIENAIEGCVNETFGALVLTWQAAQAKDPAIARELAIIARDETRHAAFAWQIAEWLEIRLDPRARRRVARAMKRAFRDLSIDAAIEPHGDVERFAGAPNARVKRRMTRELEIRLCV